MRVCTPKRAHGQEIRVSGPPRRGYVRLGEPRAKKLEFLVRLGEDFSLLGKPLLLSECRLRLGEPVIV